MPVRRGVVVWLGHAQAVHLYAPARQGCPRLGPHFAQPQLAIAGGGAGIFLVWHRAATAAQLHGVELAGQRQRDKQAHMRAGVGVFLRAPDSRHQLATAHDGVCCAQFGQLAQRVYLPGFVAEQRAAQCFRIALHLRLAPCQPVMADVAAQALVHTPHADVSALDYARNMHAQTAAPPCGILCPLNRGFALNRLVLNKPHAPHQQANAVHPLSQAGTLANGQRVQFVGLARQLLGHFANGEVIQIPQRSSAKAVFVLGNGLQHVPRLRPLGLLLQPLPIRLVRCQHGRRHRRKALAHRSLPARGGATDYPLKVLPRHVRRGLVLVPVFQAGIWQFAWNRGHAYTRAARAVRPPRCRLASRTMARSSSRSGGGISCQLRSASV